MILPKEPLGETMTIHTPVKGLPVLVAVVLAVLMVFVVASGAVEAAPLQGSSTPVGSWSYGVVKTVSVGPQPASDQGWVYQATATFGYTVTIWDNNTSATTFELTILRTMGAAFSIQFCSPSCSSPTNWVNVSYRAWETTTGISNFTTQASVHENGTNVPAIGLLNSSVWVRANLTETYDAHLPVLGWSVDKTRYLSGNIVGRSSVTFAPALGLFPVSLTPGTSWDSTSAFEATGAANYSLYYAAHGPVRSTVIGPITGPVSVAAHGNVTVDGAYAVGSSVELGGVTYPAITLTVLGPFSVREGVIFVPSTVDLFGSSTAPVAGNATGATSVEQSTLDVKAFAGGHFGLAASSWHYVIDSANPYDAANSGASSSGMAPAASAGNSVSSVTVQGEPETASQSTTTQQCLTLGSGCPLAGGSPSPRSLLGAVVVVGALVTIGALVALAAVARRRRVPPPTYPNAVLYPPGAAGPSNPARAPATPAAPPAPEDDPLNHLW
jgi:hypothetical protein